MNIIKHSLAVLGLILGHDGCAQHVPESAGHQAGGVQRACRGRQAVDQGARKGRDGGRFGGVNAARKRLVITFMSDGTDVAHPEQERRRLTAPAADAARAPSVNELTL
ncbi:hypothetical protein [Massilia sp. Root335]|uniref:hypothetical protein n=1 Tax=Massilia sp. Root335 TaxID=1736517 RepID=UPI0012F6E58A|nr:hypothetical protein [Massilia sp. Root335]